MYSLEFDAHLRMVSQMSCAVNVGSGQRTVYHKSATFMYVTRHGHHLHQSNRTPGPIAFHCSRHLAESSRFFNLSIRLEWRLHYEIPTRFDSVWRCYIPYRNACYRVNKPDWAPPKPINPGGLYSEPTTHIPWRPLRS
jgi:hypothetical protein